MLHRSPVVLRSSSFRAIYLRFDRRVLGSFRAAFGGVLLYDLLRRWPDVALLWSSDGVLSSETLRRSPQDAHQFSLLLGLSSASSVKLAFLGMGLVFLFYTLGLLTRVMQVLALVCYASLNARNLFFEDGGTGTVILLLSFTLLVPLNDRFALDTLWRDARLARVRERVLARTRVAGPLVTLAALAILLQAAAIYWLNAAHKTGGTWRGGDAVHLVLWQHRVNTPLALWLSQYEPAWLSPILTWLTKRTEFIMPVLLLWPVFPALGRSAAFVIALLLHGGIALCLTLGPFSYAMMCLVWLTVPGEALDALARRMPARLWWRVSKLRARFVRALRRRLAVPSAAPAPPVAGEAARRWIALREVLIGGMLLVEAASLLSSNKAIPKALRLREPGWLLAYKPWLRAHQSWSMFAPEAPREDGTIVVDAVTSKGRHLDPFTARAPDFEQIRRGLSPHSIALSDYLLAMQRPHNSRYRRDLARYLRRFRVEGSGEGLRSADIWWVSYTPPERGRYEPGPLKKELLWHVKLR